MNRPKIKVYVAGPYTKPNPAENTQKAIKVGSELLEKGFAPYVPHLTLLWDTVDPQPYETWIEYDFEWLAVCDVLLRLPGESSGADREIAFARGRGIPVVYTIEDLGYLLFNEHTQKWFSRVF